MIKAGKLKNNLWAGDYLKTNQLLGQLSAACFVGMKIEPHFRKESIWSSHQTKNLVLKFFLSIYSQDEFFDYVHINFSHASELLVLVDQAVAATFKSKQFACFVLWKFKYLKLFVESETYDMVNMILIK